MAPPKKQPQNQPNSANVKYPGPAVWHKPCTTITMGDLQGFPSANPRNPERPFECDWYRYPPLPGRGPNPNDCKGAYNNEEDYRRHIWAIHIRPTEVQCEHCKVWFGKNTELNKHKKNQAKCVKWARERRERAAAGDIDPPGYRWRNCDIMPMPNWKVGSKGFTKENKERAKKEDQINKMVEKKNKMAEKTKKTTTIVQKKVKKTIKKKESSLDTITDTDSNTGDATGDEPEQQQFIPSARRQAYPVLDDLDHDLAERDIVFDAYGNQINLNLIYDMPALHARLADGSLFQQTPSAADPPYGCMIHWNSPNGCPCREREEREVAIRPLAPEALRRDPNIDPALYEEEEEEEE